MKTSAILATLLAAFAVAAPVEHYDDAAPIADVEIVGRQAATVGTTANEYTRYGCKKVIFIFARGSTEVGNMGSSVGPPTGQALKNAFGATNVAVEGIDYAAALSTNFLPGGADLNGIREMKDLLNDAATRCPTSVLLAGGYSQGAALTHRAIENLSDAVKARIFGVVTYGDTQNLQDRGRIANFPTDRLKIICNTGDLVCSGTLTITAAHLDYVRRVPEATTFLIARARAGGA